MTRGGDSEILKIKPMATLLNCSPPTLVKWVREYGCPGFQIEDHGEWRFRKGEVLAWFEERGSRGRRSA